MNKQKIARELILAAKELMSAGTFKCPDCGSKVLEQTKYCVKCKKKVKKAAMRGDSRFKKSVELMAESVSDANAIMGEVMNKRHLEEAETALEPVGGRRELQKIWNTLTRAAQDLRQIERGML